jgi:hypothetical protein
MYDVRIADLRDVRDEVVSLLEANLSVTELDARLRWFYQDNPHGRGRVFVLRADGVAIGQAGIGVRMFWRNDRPIRAAVFADLAVDRAHRSGFPALALVRAVKRHVAEAFDLGYGFPNPKAEAIYRHAGCAKLGAMTRYVRVLRSQRYLARELPRRLAPVVGAIADRMRAGAAQLRAACGVRSSRLEWLDDFDPRFDRLFQEARSGYIVCDRTAAFLRWRFSPERHRIAALVDGARLLAYAVVRESGRMAELVDLFGLELDALLARIVPALYRLGYDSASVRFLGSARIPALLAAHGFVVRPQRRMVTLALSTTSNSPELRDRESWYLTDLDEDT